MSASGRERGGGTVLTSALLLVILVAMLTGMWCVGWIGAAHRARSAADLAALAGARAMVGGADACRQARRVAEENGGVVRSCRVEGTIQQFVVRVRVSVVLRPHITGGPRAVTADAVAGNLLSG